MGSTVFPVTEAEIVDAVRAARESRRTFEILGHGSKRDYGRAVDADCILDLSALTGIVRYEPEELVITAGAATSISEIAAVLSDKHQRLGFDPADWGPLFGERAGLCTIAGALSADACGSARLRYGAARDHLLGYRGVNGYGEAYKAGSHVVKNVTGFDLPKLVCGAMGTLGVLTEVTLRLVPRTSRTATLIVRNVDAVAGLALLRRIWSSALEPSGLAYVPTIAALPRLGAIGDGAALLRVEGAREPLADKIGALKSLLASHDIGEIDDGDAIFESIGSGASFVNRNCNVWRVCVPPAAAADCVREIGPSCWIADWAGGLLWLDGTGLSAESIRAIATRAGGHAVLLRASAETRRHAGVFPPETPVRAALTKKVKAAFDPLGLFNPGRMFEGI